MRLAVIVMATAVFGCQQQNTRQVVTPPVFHETMLYAAALRDSGGVAQHHAFALGLALMSDSGTYESSGRLADSVAAFLVAHGLVAEICAVRDPSDRVPECVAQHARAALRLSRPIRVASDTVKVFIGSASIQPVADPAEKMFFHMGSTAECRLVWRDSAWKVADCRQIMIT